MDQSNFHLVVNHLPIIGVMLGTLVLIGGVFSGNSGVKRTALLLIIFSGITAFLANITGEGAEEIVEEFEGVSHRVIHRHEEMGEKFFFVTSLAALFSIVLLILDFKKKSVLRYLYPACIVLVLFSCFLGYKTGQSGGKIRRPELVAPQDTVRMKR